MDYGYVYKITNLLNGKWYIGSRRCNRNDNGLNDGYLGSGVAIKRAINKYGKKYFSKEILCYCEDAYEFEALMLQELDAAGDNNSYNLTNDGQGIAGYKHTDAAKDKISKSSKGNKFREGCVLSEKHKQSLIKSNTGRKPSESTCEAISKANKGKQYRLGHKSSQEHKNRISEARLKSSKVKRVKVRCIEMKLDFETIKSAQEYFGIHDIGRAIKRNGKVGGLTFVRILHD